MGLFLRASYGEREDELKALGATWDPQVGRWYVDVPKDEYARFAKWILDDTDYAIIATDLLFIVEGQQMCWTCGMSTRVVGLGIGGHIEVFDNGEGPRFEYYDEDYEELHLAWTDREECVPAKLLEYLKGKYSVKTSHSRSIRRKCFANHCDHCGDLQGNWYLFGDPDSPLALACDGDEAEERASGLKIFEIPIGGDLLIDWEVTFGSNDYVYIDFGQREGLYLFGNPGERPVLRDEYCHPRAHYQPATDCQLETDYQPETDCQSETGWE